MSVKSQNFLELKSNAQPYSQNEEFCKYYQKTTEKQEFNFFRSAPFHMESRVCLKYFAHGCRLNWSSYIDSIAKTTSVGTYEVSFFRSYSSINLSHGLLLKLLFASINLSYGLAQTHFVMSGMVLEIAIWVCWISYSNGYVGLLVLHSLLLMNHWFKVEVQPGYVLSVGIALLNAHVNRLNWSRFLFITLVRGPLVILIPRCYNDVYVNSFLFAQRKSETSHLQNAFF